jgi:hypothetical protein
LRAAKNGQHVLLPCIRIWQWRTGLHGRHVLLVLPAMLRLLWCARSILIRICLHSELHRRRVRKNKNVEPKSKSNTHASALQKKKKKRANEKKQKLGIKKRKHKKKCKPRKTELGSEFLFSL